MVERKGGRKPNTMHHEDTGRKVFQLKNLKRWCPYGDFVVRFPKKNAESQ